MSPTVKGEPQHTGTERYEVVLAYGEDELRQIDKLTEYGDVLVEEVILVWERPAGKKWQRAVSFRNGSRAVGPVKMHDGRRGRTSGREIFGRKDGAIRSWTDRLPGLRNKVEELEATLPRFVSARV